ncbi:MAG: hypothetical protein A2Y12_19295 [Planctomycetes bacterium GWF2_42_9]|nr:MAG: hypothetical protein A2Y12_19295 [Planctomycetes bacterium GWF2_42_9]
MKKNKIIILFIAISLFLILFGIWIHASMLDTLGYGLMRPARPPWQNADKATHVIAYYREKNMESTNRIPPISEIVKESKPLKIADSQPYADLGISFLIYKNRFIFLCVEPNMLLIKDPFTGITGLKKPENYIREIFCCNYGNRELADGSITPFTNIPRDLEKILVAKNGKDGQSYVEIILSIIFIQRPHQFRDVW